jgi:hypothetical protein
MKVADGKQDYTCITNMSEAHFITIVAFSFVSRS